MESLLDSMGEVYGKLGRCGHLAVDLCSGVPEGWELRRTLGEYYLASFSSEQRKVSMEAVKSLSEE